MCSFALCGVGMKLTALARLNENRYGDVAYSAVVAHNTKAGALMKQGHHNANKWENRHVVLADSFLLYYGNKKDSTPKGIIRMDQVRPLDCICTV
jgi:hypothetical protein